MQAIRILTEGPIFKQLMRLSLPIIGTSFIQMTYSITDMLWIGHLGSEALAAIGAVGFLAWISNSVSLLNKVGSEISVGQSVGQRDFERAGKFASHNVSISLLIAIFCSSTLLLFAEPIIDFFQLETHISQQSVSYLRIIATALPFVFLANTFTGIYNGAGLSHFPFRIMAAGLVTNMLLDPLFIYGFNWGVTGAAWATWISQCLVLLLFLRRLKIKDKLLNNFPFFVKLEWRFSKLIFQLGLPAALFNTLFAFVNITLSRIASIQGGHIGLMALSTGGNIEAITWNTAQGFSTALGAFTAQNYAAKKFDRVISGYKNTLRFTMLFALAATILFFFFGEEVFSLFVSETAAYQAGGRYLKIIGLFQVFMMLEITAQGMFNGMGKTVPPAIISIVGNLIRIPLAYLLIASGLGLESVWWSISLSTILKGSVAMLWLYGIWRLQKKRQ